MAAVYAAVAFVVWQVAGIVVPALLFLPAWVLTLVFVLALLGFALALVPAWAYAITPEGMQFMADCYALLAEQEEALTWLERAVELGFFDYPFLAGHYPFLASVRGEERFQQLMRRTKLEWQKFNAEMA